MSDVINNTLVKDGGRYKVNAQFFDVKKHTKVNRGDVSSVQGLVSDPLEHLGFCGVCGFQLEAEGRGAPGYRRARILLDPVVPREPGVPGSPWAPWYLWGHRCIPLASHLQPPCPINRALKQVKPPDPAQATPVQAPTPPQPQHDLEPLLKSSVHPYPPLR